VIGACREKKIGGVCQPRGPFAGGIWQKARGKGRRGPGGGGEGANRRRAGEEKAREQSAKKNCTQKVQASWKTRAVERVLLKERQGGVKGTRGKKGQSDANEHNQRKVSQDPAEFRKKLEEEARNRRSAEIGTRSCGGRGRFIKVAPRKGAAERAEEMRVQVLGKAVPLTQKKLHWGLDKGGAGRGNVPALSLAR